MENYHSHKFYRYLSHMFITYTHLQTNAQEKLHIYTSHRCSPTRGLQQYRAGRNYRGNWEKVEKRSETCQGRKGDHKRGKHQTAVFKGIVENDQEENGALVIKHGKKLKKKKD